MAFNIVVGSKFKPFSYQEMLHPVAMADAEHKAIDAELADLGAKASVWEGLANESTDPIAYNTFKNFSNKLKESADKLADSGLNTESRRGLLGLKQSYSSDIIPIEQAYQRRRILSDEQRKLQASNPTTIYDRDLSKASLDEFISNPELNYRQYSGALLTKQVSDAVAPLARQITDEIRAGGAKANEWKKVMENQYYEKVLRTGFEPEDILAAINGEGPQILRDAVNNVIKASGIESWGNPEATKQAFFFGNQGLYSAIGKTDYSIQQNRGYDYNMKARAAKAESSTNYAPLPYSYAPMLKDNSEGFDKNVIDKNMEFLNRIVNNPKLLTDPQKGEEVLTGVRSDFDVTKAYQNSMNLKYGDKANTWHNPYAGQMNKLTQQLVEQSANSGEYTKATAKSDRDRLNKLMNEYGTDDVSKLVELVYDDSRSNAQINNRVKLELADDELLKDIITGRSLVRGKKMGIWETNSKGNKDKKQISQEDLININNSKMPVSIFYDPESNNFKISAIPDGGTESKEYVIDTETLTGGFNIKHNLDRIEDINNSKEPLRIKNRRKKEIIHSMMLDISTGVNTIHKVQQKSGDYNKEVYNNSFYGQ